MEFSNYAHGYQTRRPRALAVAGIDVVQLIQEANHVADCANLDYVISSLEQCNSTFYNDLYQSLTGSSITFNTSREGHRCQILINTLQLHLLPNVNLTHIRGCDLANLDKLSVKHILDVFATLLATRHSEFQPSFTRGYASPILQFLLDSYLQDIFIVPVNNQRDCVTSKPVYKHEAAQAGHVKTPSSILQQTENHFPFAYVEPTTLQILKNHELCQFDTLSKPETSCISRKIKDIMQKQEVIVEIVQRDLAHVRHLQESRNKRYYEQCARGAVQTRRLLAARAHKYFQDYELNLKSKFLSARTNEEQTFIRTFEKGLKLQRDKIRTAAKERRLLLENEVCQQLDAVETHCHDQLETMLTDVARLEKDARCMKSDHAKFSDSKKTKYRKKTEEGIAKIQPTIFRADDIQHFRDLDASRVQWKF